jgi:hypothetical protein
MNWLRGGGWRRFYEAERNSVSVGLSEEEIIPTLKLKLTLASMD